MQSPEGKLAEQIFNALDSRGFSIDMLAHFLVQDPGSQQHLHELVTRLIEKWTDSHNSGMFHSAADREVYAKAAALSVGKATRKTDPKNYRLPSEDVWDDESIPKGVSRPVTQEADCGLQDRDGFDFEIGFQGTAGWSQMEKDINCNPNAVGGADIAGLMWFPQAPGSTHENEH